MIGQSISHYRVLEKLGEGGMGVVYKAHDTRLDRFVALKVLPRERAADAQSKRRFGQEARAASALNHPNIITIHEIDSAASEGQPVEFIAMEYVAGKTLNQLIGRKGLPLTHALKYSVQIADALATAHGAGIIHRDLKPGNVMVTETGVVKVLDFGLAKLAEVPPLGEDALTRTLKPQTEDGTIVGTVAYMSPEQAEGKSVDARSDIFSFGSVFYEMVTGRACFQRESKASTLAAVLREEPEPAGQVRKELPKELQRIIVQCLRKDRGRRIQHMDDVKLALEDVKEELDSGQSAGGMAPSLPALKRKRALEAAGAVLAIAAASLAWYSLRHRFQPVPLVPLEVVPLTSYTGIEMSPSFSPDGSQVAFCWNGIQQDNFDIYVKLVAGGEPLRLTTDPEADNYPAWSPDGNRIAFIRANSVFLISPLGGLERRLTETQPFFHAQLAWTADAKSLVISGRSSDSEPLTLSVVSIATGERRKLTSPPGDVFGDNLPAFAPDGKQLAFARWITTSSSDLYVISGDGGQPRRLTNDNCRIGGVSWTPDGRELVFSSNRGGSFNLWRISATASPATESRRVSGGAGDAILPVISKGPPARLAYARLLLDINIWRVETPVPRHSPSAPTEVIASTRTEESPQFSPDGGKVVFASDRTGNSEIWVSNSDGSNPIQLTSLGAFSGSPRWSPDGKRIAFDSLVGANRDIFEVGLDGGAPHRLTREASQEWRPSHSRDGRWIYFGSDRSGSPQIWKVPSEGGGVSQVTRNGGYEAFEALDGKLLYYTKSRFRPGVWSVPTGGAEETQVVEGARTGYWAVADKGIYFLDFSAPPGSAIPIKLFNFSTHLVTGAGLAEKAIFSGAPGLSVTRDGASILYLRAGRIESDLVLIENFR